MSADDLDVNNVFLNPFLYRIKQMDSERLSGLNYEDITSVHNADDYPLYENSYFIPQNNVPFSGESLWNNTFQEGQPHQVSNNIMFRFDGGVPYSNNIYLSDNSTMANTFFRPFVPQSNQTAEQGIQPDNTQGSAENTSGQTTYANLYRLYGSTESSCGFSYNLTQNGEVIFKNPQGQKISAQEFKTAVGDDFNDFKAVINQEGRIRGFGDVIS